MATGGAGSCLSRLKEDLSEYLTPFFSLFSSSFRKIFTNFVLFPPLENLPRHARPVMILPSIMGGFFFFFLTLFSKNTQGTFPVWANHGGSGNSFLFPFFASESRERLSSSVNFFLENAVRTIYDGILFSLLSHCGCKP